MRHGIAAHRAAEHQKDGRKYGGLYHWQRDTTHYLVLRRIEDSRRFLQVGVHIAKYAADKYVRKRRIVKSQHYNAGEHSLTPPQRHTDTEQAGKQSVAAARDRVAVEHVIPHQRQGPLRHYVRKDKYRAEILFALHVGARNQKCEQASEHNSGYAGEKRQNQGIP